MSASSDPAPARQRLPFTLLVLAALMALKAALLLALVAGATFERLRPILGFTDVPGLIRAVQEIDAVAFLLLLFALLLLVSVVGMLSRRRTGWLLAMVITGLFVAIDIYGHLNGGANEIWMLLNIVTVFYLNQRDVREVVGAATPEPVDGAEATG